MIELPKPHRREQPQYLEVLDLYTAEQMREFALAHVNECRAIVYESGLEGTTRTQND